MVVLVRPGLGASVGDLGTVMRVFPNPHPENTLQWDDHCGVQVRWHRGHDNGGLFYTNQFALAGGPW